MSTCPTCGRPHPKPRAPKAGPVRLAPDAIARLDDDAFRAYQKSWAVHDDLAFWLRHAAATIPPAIAQAADGLCFELETRQSTAADAAQVRSWKDATRRPAVTWRFVAEREA